MDKVLLRVSEAAQMLSISRSACYELVASGQIPSIKINTAIRIPRADLEQWIEDQKQGSTTKGGGMQHRGI